ncbi:MAG: glycosyltransferase family 4 protein [Deltaproteobacteria bacterium]|nr:glycosyltransferase family 4 protein [Deltaproteobacteria bacterium]
MRILHLAPRLSLRGGADQYWLSLVAGLEACCEQRLVVGAVDNTAQTTLPTRICGALNARDDAVVELDMELRWKPDVIHIHNVVNPWLLNWAHSQPAVVTIQDHRYFCPGRGKWRAGKSRCNTCMGRAGEGDGEPCVTCLGNRSYFEQLSDLTWRRFEALQGLRLTVLSRYMRDELVALGLAEEHVAVIPPFVQDWPAGAAEDPSVLFAGRLVESKGVFDVLEAYDRVDLPWPLVFVGTGSARSALEGAGACVLGWVDRAALGAWLRGARVLVMPSRWQEPFGIIGLEALSLGTPVAAWESGGVAEWHPGGPGLVSWGDVDGLAGAMGRLARGPRAKAAVGFEREVLMAQMMALYEEVAGTC